jgi:hypothetical protein
MVDGVKAVVASATTADFRFGVDLVRSPDLWAVAVRER